MVLQKVMVFFFIVYAQSLCALTSEEIFKQNQSRIFQIKLIDIESDSKASLGSGFVAGDANTVVTNYHVVSSAVNQPEKYRIVYLTEDGSEGELSLFDIDIVNDLALLKSATLIDAAIPIAELEPNKGAVIYSLGNPLDLGMTVVPGTYNGIADHSYYERIHFSGSINSGMSGGPVLNEQGDIVGINVATAGNQIGFLIPADKLIQLLTKQVKGLNDTSLLKRAEAQLLASQNTLITRFLASEWPEDKLGEASVIGEIPDLVSCWGRSTSEDEKKNVVEISKGCSLQANIFVNRGMTTGSVEYEFYWLDAKDIDNAKFVAHIARSMGGYPGNRAGEKDVSEFTCHESFTEFSPNADTAEGVAKSVYCARRYKKFSSLYDVFYLRFAKREDKALISHFTLAGVTPQSAFTFSNKFLETVSWP